MLSHNKGDVMKKISVCLTCMLMLLCAFVGTAEARRTIVFKNKAPHMLLMAFCYQDSTSKQWIVKGWWKLKAKGTRTVHLSTNNSNVYVYAENRKHNLYYTGGKSSLDLHFTIFNQEFRSTSDTRLTSENSRRVRFDHVNLGKSSKTNYTFNYR